MGLKLLSAVSATPRDNGMTLRLANQFLTVYGKDIFAAFCRMRPVLSGEWTLDDIRQQLKEPTATQICKLLENMSIAGMIREEDFNDRAELSSIAPELQGYVSRIELHNELPAMAYKTFCQAPLLIHGPEHLAATVADAARALGVANIARETPSVIVDGSAITSPPVPKNTMTEISAKRKTLSARIIIAARLEDYEHVIALLAADLPTINCDIGYLLSSDHCVLLGRLPQFGAARIRRVLSEYNARVRSADHSDLMDHSRLQVIGARILMLRLLDSYTSRISSSEATRIVEISGTNLTIQSRPFPIWDSTQELHYRVCDLQTSGETDKSGSPTDGALECLQELQKSLVDPYTGLIRHIGEEALPQIPHHQCGAVFRSGDNRISDTWLNEAGADALQARIAVILRIIEHHLSRTASTYDGDDSSTSNLPQSTTFPSPLNFRKVPSITVAGTGNRGEIYLEAVNRALATHVEREGIWNQSEGPEWLEAQVPLVYAYLSDIGEIQFVKFQRCASNSYVEIVKFTYKDKVVSIVAGFGHSIWEVGMRDLWLHISAERNFAPERFYRSDIRYRYSGGTVMDLTSLMHELKREWRVTVDLDDVVLPESFTMHPLSLCRATIYRQS